MKSKLMSEKSGYPLSQYPGALYARIMCNEYRIIIPINIPNFSEIVRGTVTFKFYPSLSSFM